MYKSHVDTRACRCSADVTLSREQTALELVYCLYITIFRSVCWQCCLPCLLSSHRIANRLKYVSRSACRWSPRGACTHSLPGCSFLWECTSWFRAHLPPRPVSSHAVCICCFFNFFQLLTFYMNFCTFFLFYTIKIRRTILTLSGVSCPTGDTVCTVWV